MQPYHKINGLYKRHADGPFKGQFKDGRDDGPVELSCPEFELLYDLEWVGTEKIDGTNIRIHYNGLQVEYRGRTDKAQIPTFLQEYLDNLVLPFDDVFGDTEVTLYGEGYGARIQKGGGNYIPDGVGFILFDIRIGHFWLQREDVDSLAAKMGLKSVPTVFFGSLLDAECLVKDTFESKVAETPGTLAEGLVLTPVGDFLARDGSRIITKLKTKDYT